MRDHADYLEDTGAYLLGALEVLERQAFEHHLRGCQACREELDRLRPAAQALPRSVDPVAPPETLKASLTSVVEREAADAEREREPATRPSRKSLAGRMRGLLPDRARSRLVWVGAFGVLAVAILAAGFVAGGMLGEEESRTIAAQVDEERLPGASGSLVLQDRASGGILRVHGMPSLEAGRVYQLWVQRGAEVVPQSTFNVNTEGGGAAAVGESLEGAQAVLVTREAHPGARAPSEKPVLQIEL